MVSGLTMEIISYGGGVQTTALAILNATGKVQPCASHAVFADTGAELDGTYRNINVMSAWLKPHGLELVIVEHPEMPLEQWLREKSTAIPIRYRDGIGTRQCTNNWKIEPVQRWLREQGAEAANVQLGISMDEYHRMKPSRTNWVTNRFPLIDMGLSRQDCLNIIREHGLPVPPPSACYFCPYHRTSTWQHLAVFEPDLFERSADLEEMLNERDTNKDVFLSSRLRPLRKAFSRHQLPLPGMDAPDDGCGGYCHV